MSTPALPQLEFNLDEVIFAFVGVNIASQDLGDLTSQEDLDTFVSEYRENFNIARMVGVRQKRGTEESLNCITTEHHLAVKQVLFVLSKLDVKSKAYLRLNIPPTLNFFADPAHKFQPPIPTIAKALALRFSARFKGRKPLSTERPPCYSITTSLSDLPNESESDSDSELDTSNRATKRVKYAKDSEFGSVGDEKEAQWIKFPDNHPIYGLGGLMHHIEINKGKTISYRISPDFANRASAVYGNNGFTNGDTFPRRLCMLRDGMHGHTMAGIVGNQKDGAYSLTVTGSYNDTDTGDEIEYQCPLSAGDNQGAAVLKRSVELGKEIRVIRKAGCQFSAPKAGFRYDGLYKAVGYKKTEVEEAGVTKKLWTFKLVRISGQAPIATDRPTETEIEQFEKIKPATAKAILKLQKSSS